MAGIKGRSGRKSMMREFQKGNLLEVTTNWLINNFETFSKEEKMKVALAIAPRAIQQKVEMSGHVDVSSMALLEAVKTAEALAANSRLALPSKN